MIFEFDLGSVWNLWLIHNCKQDLITIDIAMLYIAERQDMSAILRN